MTHTHIMVLPCSNTPPLSNRGAARANHNHHTTEQLTSATYLLQVTCYVLFAVYNFPCSMCKSEASQNWPSATGLYSRKAATSVWHQVHHTFENLYKMTTHNQPGTDHWAIDQVLLCSTTTLSSIPFVPSGNCSLTYLQSGFSTPLCMRWPLKCQ